MKFAAFAFAALLASAAFAQPYAEKGKILGSPSAPIRIDVYSDFACPACRNFHETTLPLIVRDYVTPGKAYVVNREFPLSIEAHKYSRTAAQYAVAAGRLGIYQPVADALFRDQQSWSATGKVWETVATVLSPEQQKKVQAIFKDPAMNTVVSSDLADGQKEKINSTPTIIVSHGTQHFPIQYPVNYNLLRSLLNGFVK
jgi:protein-disulfide isomerase